MSEGADVIRVGRIQYTNVIPFYHNLEDSLDCNVEFYENFPTKVNLALRKGAIDIAPISSLEFLNHQKKYMLLPNLCIGARDFSGSVILFSKTRIEQLDGKDIALTRESLSSAVLLRVLLKYKYEFNNEFQVSSGSPEEMLKTHAAALVIGDSALMHESKEFLYKYDLSELWWQWAERPFCFALWAVRREFVEQNPELVNTFYRGLVHNLQTNLQDIEGLIRDTLKLDFLDPKFPKYFGYLFNLSYGLDEEMLNGLRHYYLLANKTGFSPKLRELNFLQPLSLSGHQND